MRLLLTAGYDRALHAVALAELAVRDGHELASVLVVSPYTISRARSLARQRGRGFLLHAARRLAGRTADIPTEQAMEAQLRGLGVRHRSLRAWARERQVPLHTVTRLDSARSVRLAREARVDAALYAGGGILRLPFLEALGGPVLNAHSGPLPDVRGMNACEWSLLLGHPLAVTIHLIDEGIDTGRVVDRLELPVEPGDTLETLRGKCIVLGVEGVRRAIAGLTAQPAPATASAAVGRQCFVMAPVLRELAERRSPAGAGGAIR